MDREMPRQRGFALLLVVWVLAILAVLAAGFAATTRSDTRLARNFVETARARALAEAGITEAIAHLLYPIPSRRWRGDGGWHEVSFGEGKIRVKIEDEAGKIDINAAAPELMSGLCAVLGFDEARAAVIVEGIASRRRLAPFAAVDELMQVPGIDRSGMERLAPYLTVYSQSDRIDFAVAPREVLLAVPGVDRREVEQLLAARASGTGDDLGALSPLTGVDSYVSGGSLTTVTIIAEARTGSGATFTRRAVVAVTAASAQPGEIREWRQEFESDLDVTKSP